MPEAGSCIECPRRTAHNTLLFAEIRDNHPDSCSDPKCFQTKIDIFVKQTIAAKPKLVQISTGYGAPKDDGAVIPRNKYVEIRQDKPQRKEQRDWPEYKTCKFTAEAIVTEGSEKGETKRVCSIPNARFIARSGRSRGSRPTQHLRQSRRSVVAMMPSPRP